MTPAVAAAPVAPAPVAITSDGAAPANADDRRSKKLVGLLAVLLIGLGLGIGALLLSQRGSDSDVETVADAPSPVLTTPVSTDEPAPTEAPTTVADTTTTTSDTTTTTDAPTTTVAETTTTAAETTTTVAETTTTVAATTTTVPETTTTVARAPDDAANGGPAESKATVRNGQIFLEGAVPTQESGEALAALAAEILGPDNVFNNYVVDPAAGDPSLGNITVEDTINFATDSAVLLDPNGALLNQGFALMTVRPEVNLTIVGHTDDRGTPEGNQRLSLARAESVKAWFVERGIDPGRLTTIGEGSSQPIATNDTAAGRTENRRIQFFLENLLGEV